MCGFVWQDLVGSGSGKVSRGYYKFIERQYVIVARPVGLVV